MDFIEINQIRCYGYTGFLPQEQVLGQWFEVNLRLGVDLGTCSQSDRIEDTLDYRQTIARVKELVQGAKFSLIERLAGAIADAVLESPQVQQANVRVTKLAPPIPDFGGRITIELNREVR
ncbi:dihydroneopterin aldolase [Geitlerinema sp. PCC 9228]|jgi:dihydroneopterin aldolase|uniref:dihydroneopterin aldolase n=1 Tax=Geitlerinema sp. PCC 9228 TaxID=111611 RepID=UPI0008F9A2CD|nr:dihydroneopterin aldolase [Geitlerinema sp. PCC 9228]